MENKNKNNLIKKQIRKVWLPLILLFLLLINLSFLPNIFTILNNDEIKLQPLLGINDDINLLSNYFNIENNNETNENELNKIDQNDNKNEEKENNENKNSEIIENENNDNNKTVQSKGFRYFLFLYVLFITGLLFILIVYKEESNLPLELQINYENENEKNKNNLNEYDPRKDGYKKLQNLDEYYYENI